MIKRHYLSLVVPFVLDMVLLFSTAVGVFAVATARFSSVYARREPTAWYFFGGKKVPKKPLLR
ncbi:MAG: hypothetical protein RR540_07395, partial [Oscillospiraceae bacterium]